MAHGRLAQPDTAARPRDATILHDRIEDDQQIEIEGSPIHHSHLAVKVMNFKHVPDTSLWRPSFLSGERFAVSDVRVKQLRCPRIHHEVVKSAMHLDFADGEIIGYHGRPMRLFTLSRKSFKRCDVFALLYPTTRSTVGASPWIGRLATDEGRKFFAYAGNRVTARVDAIMEKAWARLCTS